MFQNYGDDEEAQKKVMEEMKQGYVKTLIETGLRLSKLEQQKETLKGRLKKKKREVRKLVSFNFGKIVEGIQRNITKHRQKHGHNAKPLTITMSCFTWDALTALFQTTRDFDAHKAVTLRKNATIYTLTREQLAEITPGGLDKYRKKNTKGTPALIIGPHITFNFDPTRRTYQTQINFRVHAEHGGMKVGSALRECGLPA